MKWTKNSSILLILLTFLSCESNEKKTDLTTVVACDKSKAEFKMILPTKELIRVRISYTPESQTKGLSGVKPNEFLADEAMLFFYEQDSNKAFWMPDTYFDLDIFFMDKDYVILDVERNVPFHVGRTVPPPIATTRVIFARHVLEMASSSALSKKLRPGDQLSWTFPECRFEIESNVRQTK